MEMSVVQQLTLVKCCSEKKKNKKQKQKVNLLWMSAVIWSTQGIYSSPRTASQISSFCQQFVANVSQKG